MSIWKLGNDIEAISFRIESIRSIIEVIAEGISDNHHSSALWGCAEMLDIYIEKLEELSSKAMELHMAEKETKPTTFINITKKGKKK